MPNLIKDLKINDVSSVDRGAGRGVKVMLMKRDKQEAEMPQTIGIEDVRKAYSDGEMSASDVNALLDGAVKKLMIDGETPQQCLSRSINWRDTRFNKKLQDLFAFAVEIGKSAPANGPHGHGTVTSNSRSHDAHSEEAGMMADHNASELQEIMDAPKKMRLKIAELAHKAGISTREAKRKIMGA